MLKPHGSKNIQEVGRGEDSTLDQARPPGATLLAFNTHAAGLAT